MFGTSPAYSGFAVDDLAAARDFYADTLGLRLSERNAMLMLHLAGERDVLVYAKPDFIPATYTILNFPVPDIDAAVAELKGRGVQLEHYAGVDDSGVQRHYGPPIAWFKDPAGNILAVLEQD